MKALIAAALIVGVVAVVQVANTQSTTRKTTVSKGTTTVKDEELNEETTETKPTEKPFTIQSESHTEKETPISKGPQGNKHNVEPATTETPDNSEKTEPKQLRGETDIKSPEEGNESYKYSTEKAHEEIKEYQTMEIIQTEERLGKGHGARNIDDGTTQSESPPGRETPISKGPQGNKYNVEPTTTETPDQSKKTEPKQPRAETDIKSPDKGNELYKYSTEKAKEGTKEDKNTKTYEDEETTKAYETTTTVKHDETTQIDEDDDSTEEDEEDETTKANETTTTVKHDKNELYMYSTEKAQEELKEYQTTEITQTEERLAGKANGARNIDDGTTQSESLSGRETPISKGPQGNGKNVETTTTETPDKSEKTEPKQPRAEAAIKSTEEGNESYKYSTEKAHEEIKEYQTTEITQTEERLVGKGHGALKIDDGTKQSESPSGRETPISKGPQGNGKNVEPTTTETPDKSEKTELKQPRAETDIKSPEEGNESYKYKYSTEKAHEEIKEYQTTEITQTEERLAGKGHGAWKIYDGTKQSESPSGRETPISKGPQGNGKNVEPATTENPDKSEKTEPTQPRAETYIKSPVDMYYRYSTTTAKEETKGETTKAYEEEENTKAYEATTTVKHDETTQIDEDDDSTEEDKDDETTKANETTKPIEVTTENEVITSTQASKLASVEESKPERSHSSKHVLRHKVHQPRKVRKSHRPHNVHKARTLHIKKSPRKSHRSYKHKKDEEDEPESSNRDIDIFLRIKVNTY